MPAARIVRMTGAAWVSVASHSIFGRPTGAAIGLRQGDRGNAEQRPLHRAGDGARIGDVLGDVLAAVDAREDEIGRIGPPGFSSPP